MSAPDEHDHLARAAQLFGRLLLRELDAPTLDELRQEPVREALAAVGVELPADDDLPALAQRYFALFLHPEGALPLVQSLWRHGQYDGDAATGVRRIADAANLTLSDAARGAAPDHLGCVLILWAELHKSRPELAALLVEHHLAWAEQALQHAAAQPGFYGAVSAAARDLVGALTEQPRAPAPTSALPPSEPELK